MRRMMDDQLAASIAMSQPPAPTPAALAARPVLGILCRWIKLTPILTWAN